MILAFLDPRDFRAARRINRKSCAALTPEVFRTLHLRATESSYNRLESLAHSRPLKGVPPPWYCVEELHLLPDRLLRLNSQGDIDLMQDLLRAPVEEWYHHLDAREHWASHIQFVLDGGSTRELLEKQVNNEIEFKIRRRRAMIPSLLTRFLKLRRVCLRKTLPDEWPVQHRMVCPRTDGFDIGDVLEICLERPVESLDLYIYTASVTDPVWPLIETSDDEHITVEVDRDLSNILNHLKDFTLRYNCLPRNQAEISGWKSLWNPLCNVRKLSLTGLQATCLDELFHSHIPMLIEMELTDLDLPPSFLRFLVSHRGTLKTLRLKNFTIEIAGQQEGSGELIYKVCIFVIDFLDRIRYDTKVEQVSLEGFCKAKMTSIENELWWGLTLHCSHDKCLRRRTKRLLDGRGEVSDSQTMKLPVELAKFTSPPSTDNEAWKPVTAQTLSCWE